MDSERGRAATVPDVIALGEGLRAPSVLRCGITIFFMKAALGLCGFGRVIQWLRRSLAPIETAKVVDVSTIQAAERAVATAAALYPGRARCLEQSLVLYYLLRRQGVTVRYCHGVIPHPFEAHAWVEYQGQVINDVAEHAKRFARLPDRLP